MAFIGIELLKEKPRFWHSHQLDLLLRQLNIDCEKINIINNGFYDWLRNNQGKIIGVHFHIFDEYWVVADQVFKKTIDQEICYTKFYQKNNLLQIFLESSRDIDFSRSDDQDFGISAIIKKDSCTFCAIFEVNDIELDDFPRKIKV